MRVRYAHSSWSVYPIIPKRAPSPHLDLFGGLYNVNDGRSCGVLKEIKTQAMMNLRCDATGGDHMEGTDADLVATHLDKVIHQADVKSACVDTIYLEKQMPKWSESHSMVRPLDWLLFSAAGTQYLLAVEVSVFTRRIHFSVANCEPISNVVISPRIRPFPCRPYRYAKTELSTPSFIDLPAISLPWARDCGRSDY